MQYLVYQILTRGAGDLVDAGKALYAISPWIGGTRSVSLKDAPLVGVGTARRIIKTHLSTSLCPFNDRARYIYVARHPVSCFASTVDFLRMNLGPFEVPLADFEKWFCSNQMWWGPWTEHVGGWWERSRDHANVLFVRFEEMKRDLAATVCQITEFLGITDLDTQTVQTIVQHCSFESMKQHREAFEMSVPTVLSTAGSPFVSGAVDRHQSVPQATRDRILDWCRASLKANEGPMNALCET